MAAECEKTMKTLCLFTGYHNPYGEGRKGPKVTLSAMRKLVQTAATKGLKPFDDGFLCWINPYTTHDLLVDATEDNLIDIIKTSERTSFKFPSEKSERPESTIVFRETVSVNAIYLFGKNSDPSDVQTFYLEEDGSFNET